MHQHDSEFGFWSILSPGALLFTILLGVLYLTLIGPWRRKWGYQETPTPWKRRGFLVGLFFLYLALGPINTFSHAAFSTHMTEMALLFMVVPPLILIGLPAWVYRPLWSTPGGATVYRVLTFPLFTLILFNLLFSLYHMPVVFDAIMASPLLMPLSHLVLGFFAFLMWWPLVCPVPEKDTLSPVLKMGYVIADSILIMPACAMIAFSDGVMYQTFMGAPPLFSFLGPLDDQQMGAVAMKVIQEFAYGSVLGYTFYNWVKEHKRQEKEEIQMIRFREESGESPSTTF